MDGRVCRGVAVGRWRGRQDDLPTTPAFGLRHPWGWMGTRDGAVGPMSAGMAVRQRFTVEPICSATTVWPGPREISSGLSRGLCMRRRHVPEI